MKTLTPERFWNVFSNEIGKDFNLYENEMRKKYCSNTNWTKYMTEKLDNIGKSKFNCKSIVNEYWPRIDIACFDNEADDWGKWALEVAIEIENNPQKWNEECRKLLMINCGLKVIIGYRYRTIVDLEKELAKLEKIHKSRKYHRMNDSWILIFGPMSIEKDNIDFVAYKMLNGKIEPMRKKKIIY